MLFAKNVNYRIIILFCLIAMSYTTTKSQEKRQIVRPIKSIYKYKNKAKYRTANFIQQTSDGGYIIAGNKSSTHTDTIEVLDLKGNLDYYEVSHNQDIWVIKINTLGKTEWEREFGDVGFNDGKCIQQTNDGGYILAGEKTHYSDVFKSDANMDAFIIKLSKTGKTEWQKNIGGSNPDCANYIQQTIDNGYIMCGYTESSNGDVIRQEKDSGYAWVVKMNKTGSIEWQKLLGYHNTGRAFNIKPLKKGGYIVVGNTNKDLDTNANEPRDTFFMGYYNICTKLNKGLIAKLTSTGNIEWQKLIGDSNTYSECNNIIENDDNSLLSVGMTRPYYVGRSLDPDKKGLLEKLNAAGIEEWQKKNNDSIRIDREIRGILDNRNEGYITSGKIAYKNLDKHKYYDTTEVTDIRGNVVGLDIKECKIKRYESTTNNDYISKIDNNGSVIWQKILDVNPSYDCNNCLQKTSDGKYIFMGNKRSKNKKTDATYLSPYLIKFESSGRVLWQKELD